jgi:hypothetical protein
VREGAKWTGGAIAAIVAAFVVVILIASMGVFGWGFFQRSTADFRGKTQQIEKTRANGDYRIGAYERFYDLCAAVQSDEQDVKNLEEEAKTATPDRRAQIGATITGIKNGRAEKVTEYNADARKTDTRAHFLASDLPYQLSITIPEGGTTCTR